MVAFSLNRVECFGFSILDFVFCILFFIFTVSYRSRSPMECDAYSCTKPGHAIVSGSWYGVSYVPKLAAREQGSVGKARWARIDEQGSMGKTRPFRSFRLLTFRFNSCVFVCFFLLGAFVFCRSRLERTCCSRSAFLCVCFVLLAAVYF